MLSSPRYQTATEAIVAIVALLILAVCCHVMFDFARTTGLVIVTVLGLLAEVAVFLDALSNIVCLEVCADCATFCPEYFCHLTVFIH